MLFGSVRLYSCNSYAADYSARFVVVIQCHSKWGYSIFFSFLIFITTTCGQTIISNSGSMSLKSPVENNTKQLKEINRKQEMIAQNSHVECIFLIILHCVCIYSWTELYYRTVILCFKICLFGLNHWEQVSSGLKAWEQNCHRKMCLSSHLFSFNLENVFCFAAFEQNTST